MDHEVKPDEVNTYFDFFDYGVFAAMLLVSALIGVYFAFFAKTKQNTTSEYLMGGKTMGIFPISMSLIASDISGISILGFPAEVYTYGTQIWILLASWGFVAFAMSYAYLPVFYNLQITSSYEYLNLRFNETVRLFGSILFLAKMLLYIPIVIYVPALAFGQVTGINLHLVTPVVCTVCIFYTTLGGLKAVVWTDTVQSVVMYGSSIAVLLLGVNAIGGNDKIWERNLNSGRVDFFNFDLDPTIRHTFWTVTIGQLFSTLATFSINQAMVQRCLAMSTLRAARITVAIFIVGTTILISICCYSGMVIYAFYYKCDPMSRGSIHKSDQILPYFVMEVASSMPGLPGLFVSGVLSAALSTMSTGLNSMTGVIFQDLIKPHLKKPLSESQASFLMKIIVVIIGSVCVVLVFVVEKLGALIQVSSSLGAITKGPLLGMFTLGMFFPSANSHGALAGGLISGVVIAWISIGTQMKIAQGLITFPKKEVSVDGCNANWLIEYMAALSMTKYTPKPPEYQPFVLYRLSYMYYTVLGTIIAITTGLVVSYFTKGEEQKRVHRDLLSPVIYPFLSSEDDEKKELDIMLPSS